MQPKRTLVLMASLSSALFWSVVADANCDQTNASQADQDLWNVHGCWPDFYLWHYQAFDTNSDDWGNRGFFNACDVNYEYPKHWNAAYLMSYGLADDYFNGFHSGQKDYLEMSRARSSSEWHAAFRHQASDDLSFYGKWVERAFLVNLVETSCNLYDWWRPNASPASRGGDFVHEGTHAWLDRHGYDSSHHNGGCEAGECDYFYWHGIGAYAFGALWQEDGTGNRFHSPNQSQVEYLCDVADFPAAWVPTSVRIAAASDADYRATTRFINGPGYQCGNARPW